MAVDDYITQMEYECEQELKHMNNGHELINVIDDNKGETHIGLLYIVTYLAGRIIDNQYKIMKSFNLMTKNGSLSESTLNKCISTGLIKEIEV